MYVCVCISDKLSGKQVLDTFMIWIGLLCVWTFLP